jgi:ABC-type nickel/cobalt efflux system permease component RcnA
MGLLLIIGFFVGIRHALEADHVAAVASLTSRQTSLQYALRQGCWWGIGHTLTLLGVGGTVLWLDTLVPELLVHWLELAVGIMLLGLGIEVLYRLRRERIHFHTHQHPNNKIHFHGHAHREDRQGENHADLPHHHEHTNLIRPLLVGLVHGMAGSAALVVLTIQTVGSAQLGLLYVALFGLGSIFGMALLSVAIAIPLRYSVQYAARFHHMLRTGIGLATITLGVVTIVEQGALVV